MDLHPRALLAVGDHLSGHLGETVGGQHLLDFKSLQLHAVDRQVQGRTAGRQRHLGESSRGQDRLIVDLVVGKPWQRVGSDVALPEVTLAGWQLHVHPEQWVTATGRGTGR